MENEAYLYAEFLESERAIHGRLELSRARLEAHMQQLPRRMTRALQQEPKNSYERPNPRPQPRLIDSNPVGVEREVSVTRSVGLLVGGATVIGALAVPLPAVDAREERVVSQDERSIVIEIPQYGTLSGAQALIPAEIRPTVREMADQIGEKNPDVIQPGVYDFKLQSNYPDGYVVVKGDTLFDIARRHGTTVEVLKDRYGIRDVHAIRIGDALEVKTLVHVVTAGETLTSIAVEYGTDLNKLATLNGLTDPSRIFAGQKLQLAQETTNPAAAETQMVSASETPALVETPAVAITLAPVQSPQAVAQAENVQPSPEPIKPSASLALNNIQDMYGADAETIQNIVRYLVDTHGFSPKGASYMAASGLRESWLKTDVVGDNGTAKGLFQMSGERAIGLPDDFYGQIDHAVQDMNIDKISVKKRVLSTLRDTNAADKEVELAIRWFERYDQHDQNNDGIADGEGNRFAYGAQIYQWITDIPRTNQPIPAAEVLIPAPPTPAAPLSQPPTILEPAPQVAVNPEPAAVVIPKIELEQLTSQDAQEVPQKKSVDEYKAVLNSRLIDNQTVTEEDGITTVVVKGERVNAEIAQQFADMLVAAEEAGIDLIVLDGFRSIAEQVELRKINGCPDIWKASSSSCKTPTARPGESNHQDGNAVDFRYRKKGQILKIEDHNNPAFQWLKAHAGTYGFYNLPSEPWHWSIDGR